MAIQSLNPATGKIEQTFEAHTPAQIETMLQNGEAAFQEWRKTTFAHRAQLMRHGISRSGRFSGLPRRRSWQETPAF